MKRLLIALALLLTPTFATAAPTIGAGVAAGESSGISLKFLTGYRHAAVVGLDYSLIKDQIRLHADYIIHFGWVGGPGVAPGGSRHAVLPYVGAGAFVEVEGADDAGVRFPVGLSWYPPEIPIDVFAEVSPAVALIPEVDVEGGASLGLRYYF